MGKHVLTINEYSEAQKNISNDVHKSGKLVPFNKKLDPNDPKFKALKELADKFIEKLDNLDIKLDSGIELLKNQYKSK